MKYLICLLFLIAGCSTTTLPIFKVGDCYTINTEENAESWEVDQNIYRIDIVGKFKYKSSYFNKDVNKFYPLNHSFYFSMQKYLYNKDCPKESL